MLPGCVKLNVFSLACSYQALWLQILLFSLLCLQSSPFQLMATSSSGYSRPKVLELSHIQLARTSSWFYLCSISRLQTFLTTTTTTIQLQISSISWLNPSGSLQMFFLLLHVLDTSARAILLQPRSDHITPLLKTFCACHLIPGNAKILTVLYEAPQDLALC